jgi:hypothetical protein
MKTTRENALEMTVDREQASGHKVYKMNARGKSAMELASGHKVYKIGMSREGACNSVFLWWIKYSSLMLKASITHDDTSI